MRAQRPKVAASVVGTNATAESLNHPNPPRQRLSPKPVKGEMTTPGFLYDIVPDLRRHYLRFAVVVLLWLGATVAYRLFLSPTGGFPGPRLTALTAWYEMYCDCFKQDTFWVEAEKMHKQYGALSFLSLIMLPTSNLGLDLTA
jgi:hypothetical protein